MRKIEEPKASASIHASRDLCELYALPLRRLRHHPLKLRELRRLAVLLPAAVNSHQKPSKAFIFTA